MAIKEIKIMFFSVKTSLKIADKVYTPCVCYPVTDALEATIDKLVAEDKAVKYEKQVFFQNGKVLEAKPAEIKEHKKSKKIKAEAELEPLDEDTTVETEGF
jgi:hypothetical protein